VRKHIGVIQMSYGPIEVLYGSDESNAQFSELSGYFQGRIGLISGCLLSFVFVEFQKFTIFI